MIKITTIADRTRRKRCHIPIFESFLYYIYSQGGEGKTGHRFKTKVKNNGN